MKFDEFTIRGNKMLFWRLGNMNSNKQTHKEGSVAPEGRGIWCFPYPHYDYFFCFHQWEKHLPKKFLREDKIGVKHSNYPDFDKMTDEEAQAYWEEYYIELAKVKKRIKSTTFWYGGEFYSRISQYGEIGDWFWWDSVRDWAKVARKHIYTSERWDGKLYHFPYAKDHFEIFIPNY